MMVESDYIWLVFFRWVETIQKMFGNFTVQTVDPILWQDAEIDPSAGWSYGMAFFHTPSGRTWYAVLNRWFLGELHDFGGSWSVWCVEVYRAGIPWALLDSIHLCMVHDSEICLWSALHEMHSVVPIRYGSKSIPPKMDWLPFLWIVLYPIFDPYSIRFLLSSIRISSVVRRREDIFLNLFDGLVPVGLSECPFADSNHSILCPIHHTWVEIVEIIWSA